MIEPVYDKYNSWVGSGLCLIQLKINKGEPYCLYEDLDHEVLIYKPLFHVSEITSSYVEGVHTTGHWSQGSTHSQRDQG